nr:MAG TPA: hypothetical protein [Caudoviricetes sp.]
MKNEKEERDIENYSGIGKNPFLAFFVYSCHTSHK